MPKKQQKTPAENPETIGQHITLTDSAPSVVAKQETAASLSSEQRDSLFISLLTGKDATGDIETGYGTFTVKFPKEKDKLAIGRLMSINRGGLPTASFDAVTENRNLMCSTLNIVVVSVPPRWQKIRAKKPNWSFEEVPDDQFIAELYQKACAFRDSVQHRLTKEPQECTSAVPAGESVAGSVESGTFAGLAGHTD